MTNSKQTKRALLSSVMALLLCFTMLLGTTFAWFTDTASTSVNTIQAGTLDVVLEMKDGDNWVSAEGKTLCFTENYWEPGCTYSLPELRIRNNGNLALKYKVVITGIKGDAKLNEVITWTIGEVAQGAEQHLAAGATSEAFTIKGTMSTKAGNAYQGLKIEGIAITVSATQDTVESDSTGNQYDKDAAYSSADVNTTAKLITAGNLTINETLTIDSDKTKGNSDVIRVTGGNHTITGGSYIAYGTKSNSALRVDGGTVTIKGGVFEVKEDNNCIYAAGGNIIIEGGTFKSEKDYNGRWFTLNCQDNSGSVITVKGGAFYKFDPSNANTGKGEIVVADGYKVVNNGDWYYVIPEEAIAVSDATALNTAIANGGTIVLNSDITASDVMNITNDVTIYGCGNKITAATGATRIFNVENIENEISITLNNVELDAANAERGISFYNNSKKISLEMNNCTVTADHYAVNVASNNTDIEVIAKNSNITGYAAVQTWSANSKITLENCTLTGVNKWNGNDNDFNTVTVVNNAQNAVVTLKNCAIKNITNGTAKQYFFGIRAEGATVTATGCTYENNGTAVAASDVSANTNGEYVYTENNTYTLTIN